MADAVTTQTIIDGPRTAIMKFTNISDATGESAVTKVDVSTLSNEPSTGRACSSVLVEHINFACVGMGVRLLEDATADVPIIELAAGQAGEHFFDDFGGIPNSKASGYNGDILFTTIGAAANASYTVILTMRKQYAEA